MIRHFMIGNACHTCQVFVGCDLAGVVLGIEERPDTEAFVAEHAGHRVELHTISDLAEPGEFGANVLAMVEGVVRKLLREARQAPAREPSRNDARQTGVSRDVKPIGTINYPGRRGPR